MKTESFVLKIILALCLALLSLSGIYAQDYGHEKDIVYGYKDGMALVMDVYTPQGDLNGAGVIVIMAGGMNSSPIWSHYASNDTITKSLLEAGFVIFAVAHSSQPKYNAGEIRWDIHRAVRFIRHEAERFGIDPQKIGITGRSSGGHMALMAALAPPPADPESWDPVDKESSEVQVVVAFFPSTDLLNFGKENTTIMEHFLSVGNKLGAAFDFHELDEESKRFERVVNRDAQAKYLSLNSPLNYVTNDDPPVLLLHGDKDKLVPIQQSEILIEKLHNAGVVNKLIVRKGKSHGLRKLVDNELNDIIDWYNLHMLGIE